MERELWLRGARIMLNSPIFKGYFQKVEVSNFEVASDAFATFKVGCLTLACLYVEPPHTPPPLRESSC